MTENTPHPAPDGARRLGLLDLVFIGCGATFGSGWLFAASKVAGMAGVYSLYSWAVGGLIALLLGFIYCELGAALPKTGGVVRYPYISHGDFLGFNISLVTLVAFSSIVAIEVVAARQYASGAFPFLGHADGSPTLAGWLVQFAFLLFAYFVNRKSAKSFAWINNIVTTLKFSVPFLSIVVLAMHFSTAPFHVPLGSATPLASVVVALSTGGIIFSYLGLTPIVAAAGEVRNPQRNVPIALCTAVLFTGVVYLALQTVFIGNIPMADLRNGWVDIPGLFPLPFHDIMLVIGAAWLGRLVLVDACVSPLGTGNVFMNSTCRVAQAWLEALGAAPPPPPPPPPPWPPPQGRGVGRW
ncbi:APC family permease, partial [Acetobacter sp.]|uniref:APC family permease n=1 Tax=Acetobacter sp. TaxID=440 RepID=UPI0039E88F18